MDCQKALEILDCLGPGPSDFPQAELRAAQTHLALCPRCATIVENRRRLDRKIGRALRTITVPRLGQQRLIAQLAELETQAAVGGSSQGQPQAARRDNAADAKPVTPRAEPARTGAEELPAPARPRPRRLRLTRGLVPVAAGLVVAAITFFGAVRLLTPSLSVDAVSRELAKIDLESLETLPQFNGDEAAGVLPADSGWQKLEWCCGQVAKGLPATSRVHSIAVFGFRIPGTGRNGPISGLLAVVPRRRVQGPPAPHSLSTAPVSEYISGRIGETVSVAWTSGDAVCVCLVQGGADSLAVLQRILDEPAA